MPDNLSPADRKKTMRAVKSANTSPERRVRAMLAGSRIRGWRVNPKGITGNPDFVFDQIKIALFIDGCFWHGCPSCNSPLPVTNREYWQKKISRNIERDKKNVQALMNEGWTVIRIWEHQLLKRENLIAIRTQIGSLLSPQ